MPNSLRIIDRHQAAILAKENEIARALASAYNSARRELMARFMVEVANLGPRPRVETIQRLANNAGLIRDLERLVAALGADFEDLLFNALGEVVLLSNTQAAAELAVVADLLGAGASFAFSVDALSLVTVAAAMDQIPGLVAGIRSDLLGGLRTSLAAGDRMGDIAARLFGTSESVFSRGLMSAELMTRRAVIQTGNNARLVAMQQSRERIPGLKKQAIAKTGSARTTELCLKVHGQIQELDKPFILGSGPPKPFARRMMFSPFHWNCRTAVGPYHEIFEQTSTRKTANRFREVT